MFDDSAITVLSASYVTLSISFIQDSNVHILVVMRVLVYMITESTLTHHKALKDIYYPIYNPI